MAENTIPAQMQKSVEQLFSMSEADLELELGRRLTQTREEILKSATLTTAEASGAATVDKETLQGLPDVVRKTAHRFLDNFNRQLYSLVCDSSDPDHAKLRQAAASSAQSLALVLSGVLVASFGWLPGLASVIAVLVAKRFGKAGYDAVCQTWKEQL
jgi:hypothetical protein